jgi:hypothetical protein
MIMIKYQITKEECANRCVGRVCCRCGEPLIPIETVDNSNNPTFWAGCLSCSIFSPGTTMKMYNTAKELHKNYSNISMDDLCGIVRYIRVRFWKD